MLSADTVMREVEEQTLGQWLELDRLIVELWGSYSIPPKILSCALLFKEETARDLMGRLLPGTTEGGTTNLFGDW